ncbi:Rho GTPase-activating protein gacA [Rhynchospora pubera]|uniref:Rho GTPase-activating protein gacA n=1 Tax=Rhynchospora pubera TaxID=906938 RepID=A0AAV8ECT6_9POAL|nr:Rho GTPase-activating protein gacA [Rhynchospora pubera]
MTGVVVVSNNGCMGGDRGERDQTRKEPNFKREKLEAQNEVQNQTQKGNEQQISLLALLVAALRKSVVACRLDNRQDDDVTVLTGMEISWPMDVRHVAHVTFDRFNGFLGLPVEFEMEVPSRAPSASASVFGVSAESMQLAYDSKGNSVPTILLLMQEKLYAQGGLKAEGIFRINPENSQEEHVRAQLNRGIVPDDMDVHCLAGLIKAWFRELPEGVLDGLSPEQVLQCNTEEECLELVKLLKPTPLALLNWAIELMADVVEEEEDNKMNARNIAMVFAPNMTQMSDPLTALMHAVQVMNFLKTLILKTLREREEATLGPFCPSLSPSSSHSDKACYDTEKEEMENAEEFAKLNSDEDHDASSQQEDLSSDCETERSASSNYRMYYTSYMSEDECDSLDEMEASSLKKLEWKRDDNGEQKGLSDKETDVGVKQEASSCATADIGTNYCDTNQNLVI